MNKDANWYLEQLQNADAREEAWRRECAAAEKTYTDSLRFNILFSNTELLLAALTGNKPKPVIRVRFPKQNSQSALERETARVVGEVVERAVTYNNERTDFQNEVRALGKAALLCGRGVAWVSYEPEVRAVQRSTGFDATDDGTEMLDEEIADQKVRLETLDYKSFRFGWAQKWADVPWVARLRVMTQDDLEAEFADQARQIPLCYRPDGQTGKRSKEQPAAAAVWEIWDKESKEVVWVAENHPALLRVLPDPLGLPGFFPCVKPLQFVEGRGLAAVPEYRLYKKTAKSLENICRRIDGLVSSIKAVACAPAAVAKEINALQDEDDNSVVTVDSTEIGQNNGLNGIISEYPNTGKSAVLDVLERRKQSALNEIYEITGIADILRGQGSAEETATASRIKGIFGSLRLKSRQRRLQEFIRDVFKLITDVVCENFTERALREMSGLVLPSQAQRNEAQKVADLAAANGNTPPPEAAEVLEKPSWAQVLCTLRTDKLRAYTIEVESTATAFDEDEEEKSRRLELFKQVTDTLQSALPLMSQTPVLAPMFKNLLGFVVDAYGQSRILKESVESCLSALEQGLTAPRPQPQPSAEQTLAQAEWLKAQAEMANVEVKKMQVQLQLQQERARLEQDERKNAAEVQLKAAKLHSDARAKEADLLLKAGNAAKAAGRTTPL